MLLSIPWICCISTSKMCRAHNSRKTLKPRGQADKAPSMYIHIKNPNGQAIWENQGHAETLNKISRAAQSETFYELLTKAVLKMNKTASHEREPFLIRHSTQLDLFPIKPFLKRSFLHERC